MKKFLRLGFFLYLIAAAICLALLAFLFKTYSKNVAVLSPLPDFLTYSKNKQVDTISLWFPSLLLNVLNFNPPQISASSAVVYDLTLDKTIYSKNPKEKLPMASLTKVMTAIIAIENKRKDDKYLVRKSDLVGENAMGLSEGETLSLRELLYGLILLSGNDSAEVIAANFPGGRSAFIKAMNDKAKAFGLSDTNFTNPTGLEGDGSQHTTAYDLLVITKYAISKFPTFDDIAATVNYEIYPTSTHKAYFLENETNLLTSYPGVKGIKTGYTPEAGLCLITFLDYNGHKIIGIILNSDNRREEMKELLDFSLKAQGIKPPPHT